MEALIVIGVIILVCYFVNKRFKTKDSPAPAPPPSEPEVVAEGFRLVCTMDRAGEPQRRHEGPMIMQAKRFGRCVECGKAIRPGEVIAWRETEGARHMRCEGVEP